MKPRVHRFCMPWRQNSQVPSPWQNGTITRSPALKPLTSAPTASTTPQNSWPSTWGNSNRTPSQPQSPTQPCQSERQMPLASTRITAPSAAQSGSGSSRTTRGSRTPSITAARIVVSSKLSSAPQGAECARQATAPQRRIIQRPETPDTGRNDRGRSRPCRAGSARCPRVARANHT